MHCNSHQVLLKKRGVWGGISMSAETEPKGAPIFAGRTLAGWEWDSWTLALTLLLSKR